MRLSPLSQFGKKPYFFVTAVFLILLLWLNSLFFKDLQIRLTGQEKSANLQWKGEGTAKNTYLVRVYYKSDRGPEFNQTYEFEVDPDRYHEFTAGQSVTIFLSKDEKVAVAKEVGLQGAVRFILSLVFLIGWLAFGIFQGWVWGRSFSRPAK